METPFYYFYIIYYTKFKSYYVVWKHIQTRLKPKTFFSLNRTMQYGNCSSSLKYTQTQQGLNRTMQYGNYHLVFWPPSLRTGFKSYYVVWKLLHDILYTFHYFLFKSYYVVWKPLASMFFILFYVMFKSYYVVWKLLLLTI